MEMTFIINGDLSNYVTNRTYNISYRGTKVGFLILPIKFTRVNHLIYARLTPGSVSLSLDNYCVFNFFEKIYIPLIKLYKIVV